MMMIIIIIIHHYHKLFVPGYTGMPRRNLGYCSRPPAPTQNRHRMSEKTIGPYLTLRGRCITASDVV